MICAECCTKLDAAHKLREQCLQSKHWLMDYISKLHSVSETNAVPFVSLQNFKHEKISTKRFEQFEDISNKTNGYTVTKSTSVNNEPLLKPETMENKIQAGITLCP